MTPGESSGPAPSGPILPAEAASVRLIDSSDVLQQLLAAIAAVPAGQRLNLPALRNALVSQADVIRGIEALIAANALDPATLRPPLRAARGPGRGNCRTNVSGADLADEILAWARHQDMKVADASKLLLGAPTTVYQIRSRSVQAKTAARVRAYIAEHDRECTGPCASESAQAPAPVEGGAPTPAPVPTGQQLADELVNFSKKHGLLAKGVSMHLFGGGGGIARLRTVTPKAKTVERIRAFLQSDPPESLMRQRVARPAIDRPKRQGAARRDPTQKPDDPEIDLADRVRVQVARKGASIRRGQEEEAARLVDAGATKGANSYQSALMREVVRRREEEARGTDPIEQAKLTLQRTGRVVHSAAVTGGRKDRFVVSGLNKEATAKDLVALADGRLTQTAFNEGKRA